MNSDRLNQLLTLTANLAVVAGIVFLAFELKQNNELLEAEIRTIRHGVRTTDNLLPLQHPQFGAALIKKRHGEELTEYETLILNRAMAGTLYNYQYVFTEYSLGRVPESSLPLNAWRAELDGKLSPETGYWPDLREYWETRKNAEFDPAFVQWMDQNVIRQ